MMFIFNITELHSTRKNSY